MTLFSPKMQIFLTTKRPVFTRFFRVPAIFFMEGEGA